MILKTIIYRLSLLSLLFIPACFPEYNSIHYQKELGIKLADTLATRETVNLFYNLKKLSNKKVIFGHHNSTAYGVGWRGDSLRSDVKDVTNNFPGLYGWDFASITPPAKIKEDHTLKYVREAFKRGGINTFCWHYNNPVTGKSFYDTTIAVKHILSGGLYYKEYLKSLDAIAEYSKLLVDEEGEYIPIIFRPFHEFDGSWFWWGKNFCTRDEFVSLWRFTVSYLRDVKGVKNFIYAFSPDRNFHSKEEFLDRYPGDEYVDLLGMDDYYDFTPGGDGLDWVTKKLKIISDIAKEKNKIAAFTETGLESIPDSTWWTHKLLKTFNNDSIKIAYVLVWRNANKKHHYAPYKGHPSAKDFIDFSNNGKILFENKLPDVYRALLKDDEISSN